MIIDLQELQGGPEIVGGNFAANVNLILRSLNGSPKKVGGNYSIRACNSLKDMSGISPEIGGNVELGERNYEKFADEISKYSNVKGNIIK